MRHERVREPCTAEAESNCACPAGRTDDHELRAPAADVHDEQVGIDHATGRRAEQRQQPLLAMIDDVERNAGRVLHGDDHRPGVRGAPHGLRPHERDSHGAKPTRGGRVGGKRRNQRSAHLRRDQPPGIDRGPQPEQRRFVEERRDTMPVHAAHEQVGRVRADIDRRADQAADRPLPVSRCPDPSPAGSLDGPAAFEAPQVSRGQVPWP